jgi:mRNA-degrading endonuclease RelE of RelBE toxin-antitoxin system
LAPAVFLGFNGYHIIIEFCNNDGMKRYGVLTLKRLRTLAIEPLVRGCETFSGQERYRFRQDFYRIIYEIHDDGLVVVVVKIGHRKRMYRGA